MAQTLSLSCEKPGKLVSQLKSHQDVKQLKINGTLGRKDLTALYALRNLTVLDLSETTFTRDGEFTIQEGKDKIVKPVLSDVFYLPFENLAELRLSPDITNIISIDSKKEYQIENLHISNKVCKSSYDVDRMMMDVKVKNLHITGFEEFPVEVGLSSLLAFADRERGYRTKMIDTLFFNSLPSDRNKLENVLEKISPTYIVCQDAVILYRWDKTQEKITRDDLKDVSIVCPRAFVGHSEIKEVELPEHIPYLFKNTFLGCSVDKLTLDNPTNLQFPGYQSGDNNGTGGFSTSSFIKEIYIGSNTAPMASDDFFSHQRESTRFYIPAGTRKQFAIGKWKEMVVREIGAKTAFNFVIETPGTLEKYITDDIVATADSLTLTGIIYDTDIPSLERCNGLRYLDLTKTLILKSPKTQQEEKEKAEAFVALLGFALNAGAEQAQHDYDLGLGNLGDAIGTKAIAEYFNSLTEHMSTGEIKADNNCIMPYLHFDMLEELRLPLLLKELKTPLCSSIRSVVLPPALEKVNMKSFASCHNLENILFPASVKEIEGEASELKYCKNLKTIDLSQTSVSSLNSFFRTTPTLHVQKLRLPRTVKELDKLNIDLINNCDLYIPIEDVKGQIYISNPHSGKGNITVNLHVLNGYKVVWGDIHGYGVIVNLIDDL